MESANIVGYQNVTIESGYGMFTPTFVGINTDEVIDLTEITALNAEGQPFNASDSKTRCNGAIMINKVKDNGNYAATYKYYQAGSKLGWYSNTTAVAFGDVKFAKGEAFLINNGYKANNIPQSIQLRTAGNVAIVPATTIAIGYSMYGNFTPVEIDLTDVVMLNAEGQPFNASDSKTRCNGAIMINKVKDSGNYGATYKYYQAGSKLGWYSNTTQVASGDVKFKPGEAFLINNGYKTNNIAQPVTIQLPSPIAEKKGAE